MLVVSNVFGDSEQSEEIRVSMGSLPLTQNAPTKIELFLGNKTVANFNALYPINNSLDVDPNKINFTWESISGIKDYNLYINGTWSIAEYDAKTSRIICYFNEQTQKGKITIKLEVKDKMENISKFELTAER